MRVRRDSAEVRSEAVIRVIVAGHDVFSLRLPGRVVGTNGQVDAITGEVF